MSFSKLIKKLQLPSEYKEAAFEVFGSSRIKFTTISGGYAQPGDILTFSYRSSLSSRRFLVVSTDANSDGKFMSGKGNFLICGYDLTNKETLPGLSMILSSFYKSNRSTYKTLKKFMDSLFGKDSYRTFNINIMKSAFSLEMSSDE